MISTVEALPVESGSSFEALPVRVNEVQRATHEPRATFSLFVQTMFEELLTELIKKRREFRVNRGGSPVSQPNPC